MFDLTFEILCTDDTLSDEDSDHPGGVVAKIQRGAHGLRDVGWIVSAVDIHTCRFEGLLRGFAHGNLPGIEFAPLSAHGNQHHDRHAAFVLQREHVDAVAHAARLQQQYAPLAANPRAAHHGHPFFFSGQ
jgi:hypothetical protein